MNDQRYPHLLDLSTNNEYPLGNRTVTTFGAGPGSDVALSGSGDVQLFQIEATDGKWFISLLDKTLKLSVVNSPGT